MINLSNNAGARNAKHKISIYSLSPKLINEKCNAFAPIEEINRQGRCVFFLTIAHCCYVKMKLF